jgi:hypothetical protein
MEYIEIRLWSIFGMNSNYLPTNQYNVVHDAVWPFVWQRLFRCLPWSSDRFRCCFDWLHSIFWEHIPLRMRPIAIALGACTLASLTSASFVDFSKTPTSAIVPRKGAFSIWGVIYTLLAASAVVLASTRAAPASLLPHVLACVALGITCAWSATVTRHRRVATLFLTASALSAWASLYGVRDNLLYSAAYGLLAGWLSVATTISTGADDTRTLVVASTMVGSASVGLSTPWPCLSLLWGLACQRVVDRAVVGSIVLTLIAIVGSVLRQSVS